MYCIFYIIYYISYIIYHILYIIYYILGTPQGSPKSALRHLKGSPRAFHRQPKKVKAQSGWPSVSQGAKGERASERQPSTLGLVRCRPCELAPAGRLKRLSF